MSVSSAAACLNFPQFHTTVWTVVVTIGGCNSQENCCHQLLSQSVITTCNQLSLSVVRTFNLLSKSVLTFCCRNLNVLSQSPSVDTISICCHNLHLLSQSQSVVTICSRSRQIYMGLQKPREVFLLASSNRHYPFSSGKVPSLRKLFLLYSGYLYFVDQINCSFLRLAIRSTTSPLSTFSLRR